MQEIRKLFAPQKFLCKVEFAKLGGSYFSFAKKSSKSPCILFTGNGMVSEWYCIRPEFDGCFMDSRKILCVYLHTKKQSLNTKLCFYTV